MIRALDSDPTVAEAVGQSAWHAEARELMEEVELVATQAIVTAVRAIIGLARGRITVVDQLDINGRALDETWPLIENHLALVDDVRALDPKAAPR